MEFLETFVGYPPIQLPAELGINAVQQQPNVQIEQRLKVDSVPWRFPQPSLLLCGSGTASLIYQVLWVKQLSLVVGVDVHAVTTVVSGFFAGLALGSEVFGRIAQRSLRPLRLFALLEAGVAVLGVALTLALAEAAAPFAWLESRVGIAAMLAPFICIGLPAVLMGGTLPAMLRALQPSAAHVAAAGGGMYAANTAGAVLGALLAPFVLIPALGVQGSAFAAATVNLAVACSAGWLVRGIARENASQRGRRNDAHAVEATRSAGSSAARRALALYAVAGGIALGYEIIWSQAVVQFMSTRSFSFAIMLATYLFGLVVGSALHARFADRVRDPWGVFGLLVSGAGMLSLVQFAGLGPWLPALQSEAAAVARYLGDAPALAMSARFVVAAVCVVLLPALLLGAAFPAAMRLAVDVGMLGRDTGRVLALNTVGGIVGSLLAGFVLVPALGLIGSLSALALCATAVGLWAVLPSLRQGNSTRFATLAVGIATLVTATAIPRDRLAQMLAASRGGELAFYEESDGGTVAVVRQRSSGGNEFRRLYIQGVSNSGDAMTSLRYMRLQALLPLIVHNGDPRSALVVGLGTGITAGALLHYPGLEHRVVAELLPAVLRAAPQFHGNASVASDPRMDIRLRDGRQELLRSEQRYDLITLEPPPPSASGVVNLYSSDFYALAATRLAPRGLFAQWLPLPTQNDEDTRALVRSFIDVFPHATLWTTELHEMLLVGSMEPIELDVARITARFGQPDVAATLSEVGIASPASLLATWVTGREGLESYAAAALPVTDDRPRIEYAPWVRRGEFARVLPRLLALGSPVPLVGADAAFAAAVDEERRVLTGFYRAGLHAYAREREAWAREMREVMRADAANPYYRWFFGEARR